MRGCGVPATEAGLMCRGHWQAVPTECRQYVLAAQFLRRTASRGVETDTCLSPAAHRLVVARCRAAAAAATCAVELELGLRPTP